MDSISILSGITDATSPGGMARVNLKDETVFRGDYYYENDSPFNNPLLVRGTNKQLTPYANMMSFGENESCSVNDLARMCKNVDDNLRILTVDNISNISITHINDTYMILECNDETYVISTVKPEKQENVAFKAWSETLKVPYAYSKKNPGFLNEANFQYWKEFLTSAQDTQIPVDIVFMKEPVDITLQGEEDVLDEVIKAHLVVNILKSNVIYERKGVITEIEHPQIEEKVPLLSRILSNIESQIKETHSIVEVQAQQYSLGYTGINKGRHYVRLVLNNTGADFEVDGDTFVPAITIESDFTGKSKDFGYVLLNFSLLRQVCSNGLVVSWNEKQKENLKDAFIVNYCDNRGITKGSEFFVDTVEEAASKFNILFSNNGIRIPVNVANSTFSKSLFNQVFDFFLKSLKPLEDSLSELSDVEFDEDIIDEKEFVSTVHNLSSSMQIPAEVVKNFIIEYIVGTMQYKDQIFTTPMDIVNYLTFVCRAFDSSIQLDVEKKAYAFAYALMQIFIYNKKHENSVYEDYRRRINPDMT